MSKFFSHGWAVGHGEMDDGTPSITLSVTSHETVVLGLDFDDAEQMALALLTAIRNLKGDTHE